MIFKDKLMHLIDVINNALSLQLEYKTVKDGAFVHKQRLGKKVWKRPEMGSLRLNTDGAIFPSHVIRRVLVAFNVMKQAVSVWLLLSQKQILETLQKLSYQLFSEDYNYAFHQDFIVSQLRATIFWRSKHWRRELKLTPITTIYYERFQLLKIDLSCRFQYVRGNYVAHKLARFAWQVNLLFREIPFRVSFYPLHGQMICCNLGSN